MYMNSYYTLALWIHIPMNSYHKLWIHSRHYEFIPTKSPDGFFSPFLAMPPALSDRASDWPSHASDSNLNGSSCTAAAPGPVLPMTRIGQCPGPGPCQVSRSSPNRVEFLWQHARHGTWSQFVITCKLNLKGAQAQAQAAAAAVADCQWPFTEPSPAGLQLAESQSEEHSTGSPQSQHR
jgi:hypothetical protein